jgi:hypothetical protein
MVHAAEFAKGNTVIPDLDRSLAVGLPKEGRGALRRMRAMDPAGSSKARGESSVAPWIEWRLGDRGPQPAQCPSMEPAAKVL